MHHSALKCSYTAIRSSVCFEIIVLGFLHESNTWILLFKDILSGI